MINKKTVVITGATGAIGKATALELAKNNCHIIMLGRNAEKLSKVKSEITRETGNSDIEIIVADLSEAKSIKLAANEIKSKHKSLNGLVNVAAIFKKDRQENSGGLEYMFATNHLGPFILTNELLDLLKAGKPARIVTVSAPSFAKINLDDLQSKKKFSSGFNGSFGASKMMNLMFTYSLARRIEGTGVSTSVFHPGLVKSDLTKDMPKLLYYIFKAISGKPDKAAKMLCNLVLDQKYQYSNGTFLKFDGKVIQSNKYSYDKDLQEKLWALSEQLLK
jgi:NAD(P)-dependent dehydrogenase (short-subunit alcohol dehydrogenase family)